MKSKLFFRFKIATLGLSQAFLVFCFLSIPPEIMYSTDQIFSNLAIKTFCIFAFLFIFIFSELFIGFAFGYENHKEMKWYSITTIVLIYYFSMGFPFVAISKMERGVVYGSSIIIEVYNILFLLMTFPVVYIFITFPSFFGLMLGSRMKNKNLALKKMKPLFFKMIGFSIVASLGLLLLLEYIMF